MAAAHEITCINKDDRYSPFEAIKYIGGSYGGESTGGPWRISLDVAIQGVEQGKWEFFVTRGPRRVRVLIAISPHGNKYLKTEADGAEPNNLLSLPECLG